MSSSEGVAAASKAHDVIDLSNDTENSHPNRNTNTSNAAPAAKFVDNNGCIEILDDSDDEGEPKAAETPGNQQSQKKRELSESNAQQAPRKKASTESKRGPREDEEIQIVVPEKMVPIAATSSSAAMDDEIELVGSIGSNALADFPHSREHCVTKPFRLDPKQHCPNCYCYVCDTPVAQCLSWSSHCHASDTSPFWKQQRKSVAQQKAAPFAAATAVAAPAPQPFLPALFELYLEANLERQRERQRRNARPAGLPTNTHVSAQELFEDVTRLYPREEAPPPALFRTKLYHYQKQSLAFMIDVERNEAEKGGWLCSEVGMGKSACIIALVASNPSTTAQASSGTDGRTLVKATVIMTSVTDECKKHAPNLVTYRHHPSSGHRLQPSHIRAADIIITSATISWKEMADRFSFHRVVMDESHLLGSSSASIKHAIEKHSERRWCVTATPCTSSISELYTQQRFLGLSMAVFEKNTMKRHMIRHVKSQLINGAPALSLIPSTSTTKVIHMHPEERRTYLQFARQVQTSAASMRYTASISPFTFEVRIHAPLMQPLMTLQSSKIEALKVDIHNMRTRDRNMRAVIFTQFLQQEQCIVSAMKSLRGMEVYVLKGSVGAARRDKIIRQFQSLTKQGPAVFVATLKAGSVGMTLTAASHVFLMEPCIMPATETQAAGRIHRLGQTKQVGVTRYVYADSFEANIKTLHDQIAAGQKSISATNIPQPAAQVLLQGL